MECVLSIPSRTQRSFPGSPYTRPATLPMSLLLATVRILGWRSSYLASLASLILTSLGNVSSFLSGSPDARGSEGGLGGSSLTNVDPSASKSGRGFEFDSCRWDFASCCRACSCACARDSLSRFIGLLNIVGSGWYQGGIIVPERHDGQGGGLCFDVDLIGGSKSRFRIRSHRSID